MDRPLYRGELDEPLSVDRYIQITTVSSDRKTTGINMSDDWRICIDCHLLDDKHLRWSPRGNGRPQEIRTVELTSVVRFVDRDRLTTESQSSGACKSSSVAGSRNLMLVRIVGPLFDEVVVTVSDIARSDKHYFHHVDDEIQRLKGIPHSHRSCVV